MSSKFLSGKFKRCQKKTRQFNIRMSEEQRTELEEMCERRGRPLSFQVEHLIALAKLPIDFCDGNDDLKNTTERPEQANFFWQRRAIKPCRY
jgi:hypothetical protein